MSTLLIDTHNSKRFYVGHVKDATLSVATGDDAATQLIEKIDQITNHQIKEIIIIRGPGSLTGLRIGSAAAYGIAAGNQHITVRAFTVWELIARPNVEIYFFTGTKKWLKVTAQNNQTVEEILEIDEITETNKQWISNNPELLQLNMSNNIPYPNMIELMAKNVEKATQNTQLLYPITLM